MKAGARKRMPAHIDRTRRALQHSPYIRPDGRDHVGNTPRLGDNVEQSRLSGGVGLEPVGNGPGLARGERGGRGALGAELVEDGGNVFEAFADLLPRTCLLATVSSEGWGGELSYLQRPGSEEQKGCGDDVDLAGGAHEILAHGGEV